MNNKPFALNRRNIAADIYRSIEQIWQKVNKVSKSLSTIVDLYDINYKISDLLFFINFNKYKQVVKRITASDSPYTVLVTDKVLFCDTDGGAITVNLPAGVDGTNYRPINCGSSGNDVTLEPNGTDKLFGSAASYAITDGTYKDIVFESTEGWF